MTLRDLFYSRLGLERAKTAREALDVITGLLSAHGQGGNTCEDHNFGQWTYHNSYIIVDPQEAWLLDTAGKLWAAKKVTCKDYEISLFFSSKFDSLVVSRISEYKTCWTIYLGVKLCLKTHYCSFAHLPNACLDF